MASVSRIARPLSAPVRAPASDVDRARIDADVAALEGLGVEELRLQWRNRWGRLAPAHLSRTLLFRLMAYRIQADAFGDLDRQTAKMLDRLAAKEIEDRASVETKAAEASNPSIHSPSKTRGSESLLVLKPGALLTREWQGRIERVMALEDGFAWNGKTYASLSAVAFAITGVKWNGHRFFFGPSCRSRSDRGGGTGAAIEQRKVKRDPTSSAEASP
ncbi:MAG: DUF2924 domain-containing protein [Roseiarcus sp.]|jgi:hypothetical protein